MEPTCTLANEQMGVLDVASGASLIGTWVASLLLGLSFTQAFHYFSTFPNDGWTRKGLVISTLLFTLVALAGTYSDVYLPLVTFWGNPEAFTTKTWSVQVYTIFNALVAAIVNSYLISRFYTLSKNIVVTIVLLGTVLLALVTAILSVLLFPGIQNFKKAEKLALIWAIASAVSDVLIASALVWTLAGKKSFKDTRRLMHRVMSSAIQNGGATSLVAIAGMIATIVKNDSNIPATFFFLLGPLYVLTLLSNFNLRNTSESGSRNWSSGSRNNNLANTNILVEGIHMRRTEVVTSDSEIEMARKQQDGRSKEDPNVAPFNVVQHVKVSDFS
ncbi:hypothetical protein B0H19DRAFT_1159168 [Mycena capillaripes]|nr:hypothetical protein B0H19DRAFT_1159168 [Mycena capillaripes]